MLAGTPKEIKGQTFQNNIIAIAYYLVTN